MLLLLLGASVALVAQVSAHGRLMVPPSRMSAWREDAKRFPVNYNDPEMWCGGFAVQWQQNGGKCSICGEAWHTAKKYEKGGELYRGIIVRSYNVGEVITVDVDLTVNHKGYFQFKLCKIDGTGADATLECLNKNVLKDTAGRDRIPIDASVLGRNKYQLQLPAGLECKNCVLQWMYNAGNSWGTDPITGASGIGLGPQEQFYACADISIGHNLVGEVVEPVEPGSIVTPEPEPIKSICKDAEGCPRGPTNHGDVSTGCKRFYTCVHCGTEHETKHYFDCPGNTIFDTTHGVCNFPQRTVCRT